MCHAVLRDRVKVIVLRGSPAEYLLVRGNNYRGQLVQADTMETAVSHLMTSQDEAVLLTDAVVADHLARTVLTEAHSHT